MGVMLQRVLKKRLLQHYISSMINTFVTSHFGLEKYFGFQPRISKTNMVRNQAEVAALRQLQTQVLQLKYWSTWWLGHFSKSKALQEERSQIHSINLLAAINLPCSSKIDIPVDLTLHARDDSGESDSCNFWWFDPYYGWEPT